jgi:DnaJ-class molecular chaperone
MIWLIGAAVVAGFLVDLYVHPFKPCGRCGGKGTNRGSRSSAYGQCKRCHGTRTVQRIGSRQLHRAVRSANAARNNRKD